MSEADSQASWAFVHRARDTLVVTGPDRVSWLNGVVTCDVTQIAPGAGAFGLALTRTGKIQTDLWILADDEQLFVAVAPGMGAAVLNDLGKMLIMEDAELADQTQSLSWVSVHGPEATDTASWLTEKVRPKATGRVPLAQAGDWLLVAERSGIEALSEPRPRLLHEGTTLGDESQWQTFCIEHGLPLFGVDYDSKDNPHDASLERRAVSWSKGCYLGQEVVCMQDMRGKPKRRIVPLVLDTALPVAASSPVLDESGHSIGLVTSSAFSSRLGHTVVMARISAEQPEGPEVSLVVDGKAARRIVIG